MEYVGYVNCMVGMWIVWYVPGGPHSLAGGTCRTVTTSTNYSLLQSVSVTNNEILSPFLLQNKDKMVLWNTPIFKIPRTHANLTLFQHFRQGFFSWGGTGAHLAKILSAPPHLTLVPIFGPRLVPPPQPRFIPENLTNLNTFLCQKFLQKLCFMLKIAKNGLILH